MKNQDLYLNQLGIIQYLVRKPSILRGGSSIDIADNIRLIVITHTAPKHEIFKNILNAINLDDKDCLILSPTQLMIPLKELKQVIWFIDQTLPESWVNAPEVKSKAIISTTSLSELAKSPTLKRQLWNTLCQYENYFKTH